MLAVFKREFLSYFRAPVGYIAIALFSFLSGYLFVSQFSGGSVNISSEVISLRSFFIIIVPIITMGLFAEDKKRGTEIIYYTAPISMFSVVIGKFLAAMALIGIMFCNVFVHMVVTAFCGGVIDIGSWGSVIVYFFLAALFVSIGLMASAITDSQIISAIVSFVILLCIQLLTTIASLASNAVGSFLAGVFNLNSESVSKTSAAIVKAISWLDPFVKTQDFRYGVFSVAPLFFCFSMAMVFIFLTYRVLEKKRWSQN